MRSQIRTLVVACGFITCVLALFDVNLGRFDLALGSLALLFLSMLL